MDQNGLMLDTVFAVSKFDKKKRRFLGERSLLIFIVNAALRSHQATSCDHTSLDHIVEITRYAALVSATVLSTINTCFFFYRRLII